MNGQIGDNASGSANNRKLPVQVKGPGGSGFLTEVASIEAGQAHSVAAKASGTVWAWGLGTDGRLGNGGTAQQNAPVQSGTLTLVTQIAAGDKHTLAHATVAQSQRYGYDRVYRLTAENADSYAYDPAGNRSSATVRGVSTAYSYDRADRITAAGAIPYTVNAAGNLTARGADSFTYDQANRLTGATVSGTTTTYAYDGDGIRIARTQGTTTSYVHDRAAGLPTVIDDGSRRYVLGPSGLAYSLAGTALSVHHTDALGSVRALSDSAAALTQRYQRDAWGNQTVAQGSSTQPFGFTGELNDASTGLLHLRAREYDPASGRFLQQDVELHSGGSASIGLNRFAYVGGNPVIRRDPSGRAFTLGDEGGACTPELCGAPALAPVTPLQQVFYDAAGAVAATSDNLTSGDPAQVAGAVASVTVGTAAAVAFTGVVLIPAAASAGATTAAAVVMTGVMTTPRVYPALMGAISNPRLLNAAQNLFQRSDRHGGGTIYAAFMERATGQLTGGTSHLIKASERATQLGKILREESLGRLDHALAQQILSALNWSLGR